MPRSKKLLYHYRILTHEGVEEHIGPTSPFLHEAVIVLFSMAERGENNWSYQLWEGDRLLFVFRRTALGVEIIKVVGVGLPGAALKLPAIRVVDLPNFLLLGGG